VPPPLRITTRNARFQQWQALLGNRTKRQRAGEFLVHGVRPISLAVRFEWPLTALLYDGERDLSTWAREMLSSPAAVRAVRAELATELMAELGEKDERAPELIAVAALPPDSMARLAPGAASRGGAGLGVATHGGAGGAGLGVVFDRPTGPGNIGTLIRSADAFGAEGVVVTGHAADPYDPRSVRASAGSLFAVPVIRVASHREVLAWRDTLPPAGRPQLVATDEHGDVDVAEADLAGPTYIVVGNETNGLSAAWRDACEMTVRIPMTGSASSLNAASAATVVLYEAARQRARNAPAADGSAS
jgi:tRNA G18 (ribose-2'-O)-methylase SpoU